MQNQSHLPHTRKSLVAAFRGKRIFFALVFLASLAHAQTRGSAKPATAADVHAARQSPLDLELAGDLAHLPTTSSSSSSLASGPENRTVYVTRERLLAFPQVAATVTDDANFTRATRILGVALEELANAFAAAPASDLVIAICSDKYRAYYPHAYIAAHHPVLVLTIDRKPPSGWPKDSQGHNLDMGPYLISHPDFKPSSKDPAQSDEPQIPWGVVRLEFRDEAAVFGAIAPSGPRASDAQVQLGYRIARQNCFRCHHMGDQGGQKAGRPWLVLSAWASASPGRFTAYIQKPKAANPRAEMPGFPEYNAVALRALVAYFQTFSGRDKP
jgi:mono/diheme cytochrome c family protein